MNKKEWTDAYKKKNGKNPSQKMIDKAVEDGKITGKKTSKKTNSKKSRNIFVRFANSSLKTKIISGIAALATISLIVGIIIFFAIDSLKGTWIAAEEIGVKNPTTITFTSDTISTKSEDEILDYEKIDSNTLRVTSLSDRESVRVNFKLDGDKLMISLPDDDEVNVFYREGSSLLEKKESEYSSSSVKASSKAAASSKKEAAELKKAKAEYEKTLAETQERLQKEFFGKSNGTWSKEATSEYDETETIYTFDDANISYSFSYPDDEDYDDRQGKAIFELDLSKLGISSNYEDDEDDEDDDYYDDYDYEYAEFDTSEEYKEATKILKSASLEDLEDSDGEYRIILSDQVGAMKDSEYLYVKFPSTDENIIQINSYDYKKQ